MWPLTGKTARRRRAIVAVSASRSAVATVNVGDANGKNVSNDAHRQARASGLILAAMHAGRSVKWRHGEEKS
jgi:hypothetical protein